MAVAEEFRIGGTCVVARLRTEVSRVRAAEFGEGFMKLPATSWSADNVRFDWATLWDNIARDMTRLSAPIRRTRACPACRFSRSGPRSSIRIACGC